MGEAFFRLLLPTTKLTLVIVVGDPRLVQISLHYKFLVVLHFWEFLKIFQIFLLIFHEQEFFKNSKYQNFSKIQNFSKNQRISEN